MKRKTLAAAMALGLSLTLAPVALHAQDAPDTQLTTTQQARHSEELVGQPVLGHDGQTKGTITRVNADQSVVIRKVDGKEMTVPYDKLKFTDLDNGEIKIMMAKDKDRDMKADDSARRPVEPRDENPGNTTPGSRQSAGTGGTGDNTGAPTDR